MQPCHGKYRASQRSLRSRLSRHGVRPTGSAVPPGIENAGAFGLTTLAASRGSPLVLLASADDSFAAFVIYVFDQVGLRVLTAADGKQLGERLRDFRPDALLLESRLPDTDIRTLCAELRLEKRTRSMAVLVLLAAGDEAREGEIVASGADECLARPFRPEQLLASVRKALQEGETEAARRHLLTFRDIELDLAAYLVRRNGQTVHLAPTEFRLLRHLMRNPDRVLSRNELQTAAWPPDIHVGARTIDVHIGRLRQALKEAGGPDPIRTVRSVGYALSR